MGEEVKLFCLVGDVQLLGVELAARNDGAVVIKEPVQVMSMMDQQGQLQVGLVPWKVGLYVEDNRVELYYSALMAPPQPANEELTRQYATIFGKIITPSRKLELVH